MRVPGVLRSACASTVLGRAPFMDPAVIEGTGTARSVVRTVRPRSRATGVLADGAPIRIPVPRVPGDGSADESPAASTGVVAGGCGVGSGSEAGVGDGAGAGAGEVVAVGGSV